MVPQFVGLTDQTRENPAGGFGEAVNVVVDPGPTVAESGSTVIFRARGAGFETVFSTGEPFPQLVRNAIANASPSRIAKASLPSFPFGVISAKSSDIGVSHQDTNRVRISEWTPSAGIWNAKIRCLHFYFGTPSQDVLFRKRLLRKEMLRSQCSLCSPARRTLPPTPQRHVKSLALLWRSSFCGVRNRGVQLGQRRLPELLLSS